MGTSSCSRRNPYPTISPNTIQVAETSISELNLKVDKLRDENYQKAIKVADEAGEKADKLLNWIVSIATIFGVALAFITFVIGGSLINGLRELRAHVNAARKNALFVAALSKQAQEKGEELKKEMEEIKKKQDESKGKIEAQGKEMDTLISKAQGTIADISALKNSANFISGASYPPYTGTAPMGFPSYGNSSPSVEKCDKCGKPINYAEHMSYNIPWFSVGETLCLNCWKEKYGNG